MCAHLAQLVLRIPDSERCPVRLGTVRIRVPKPSPIGLYQE